MEKGEVWVYDPAKAHGLINDSGEDALHLIIETKNPDFLTKMSPGNTLFMETICRLKNSMDNRINIEPYNFEVLEPAEMSELLLKIDAAFESADISHEKMQGLKSQLKALAFNWKETFVRFGHHPDGELAYRSLIKCFKDHIYLPAIPLLHQLDEPAGSAMGVIRLMLETGPRVPRKLTRRLIQQIRKKAKIDLNELRDEVPPSYEKPVFIVAAPRSGKNG